MKRIGFITSGGDAPGMNAAIRAVVRTCVAHGVEAVGYDRGWQGVIEGASSHFTSVDVGGIISKGGTMLRSARSEEFRTKEGRAKAHESVKKDGVEGLVVIGGDGSLTGANIFGQEFNFPVMGVPASIDNDIPGTDFSIGFDTALNTAVEAVDKVRDTAYSHERIFVIEVMGRDNGFIALDVALACGAEAVLLPEVPYSLEDIRQDLKQMRNRGKVSSIVVVAEGAAEGDAESSSIKDYLGQVEEFEVRHIVLGHMQRGGSPTAYDRVLALRLGSKALEMLISGSTQQMVGIEMRKLVYHELYDVLTWQKMLDPEKLALVNLMAQ